MPARISTCIPTCNRPGYFEEALTSVLRQDPSPFEIVVGDDSAGTETAQLVQRHMDKGAPIKYLDNDPPLGQAKNVDRCFQEAEGDFILLLHDDDLLIEGALDVLWSCFEEHKETVAAFGKQQIVNAEGEIQWGATRNLNESYYRTSEYEGVQPSSLRSAVIQQFPNDGFMVRAEVAKQVGYARSNAGDACDFAFGVSLAKATRGDFHYTDTYTSKYRRSDESIVRGEEIHDTGYHSFRIVTESLDNHHLQDAYIKKWLKRKSPVATLMAAQKGDTRRFFKWYFSKYHRSKIFSLGGFRRFIELLRKFLHSI